MPDPLPLPRRTSRRRLLGLAAAGTGAVLTTGLASGCDVDDLRPPEAEPSPSPTTAPGQPTADEQAVDEVSAALSQAVGVLVAARTFPALRPSLTSLLRAHRTHLAALEADPAREPRPSYAGAPDALAAVEASEQALRTTLVSAAGAAESGALARLLASAAASVDQHLAVLG